MQASAFTIDENNQPLGIRGDEPLDCQPQTVLKSGLLIHPTVMGRTSWFRANPYDSVFVRAEDQELWVRACQTTVFGRLQDPLFFYRESLVGNLGNYLRTARTVRKILRVYGPPMVGRGRTAMLLARSHLKSAAFWMCTKVGWQGRLIQRRVRGLNRAEIEAATSAIREILQTRLPGASQGGV